MHFIGIHHNLAWSINGRARKQFRFVGNVAPTKLHEADDAAKRQRALKRVDRALSKGNHKIALSLVKQLQGKPGGLRGFGAAKQVPKKPSSLEEPELHGIDLLSLRPLVDSILVSIERCIQLSSLEEISEEKLEKYIKDDGSKSHCEENHFICAQHEAGHFLVGYLLGVLPKVYKVPSIHDLSLNKFAEGSVAFVGFEFLGDVGPLETWDQEFTLAKHHRRVEKGKISSKKFNQFLSVILGGLVTEHLLVGYSDGHYADVEKLERVLQWMEVTKSERVFHVRWAALNTAFLLQRHFEVRSKLAEVMASGRTIGFCIDTIESCLAGKEV